MAGGPIDLIQLAGEGSSVILRITGMKHPEESGPAGVLEGEILVGTAFVQGQTPITVSPEDLREWQEALDALDAGHDIAWREHTGGPEVFIERADEDAYAQVTVRDRAESPTSVTVTVPLADAWFDDAYRRLDLTWRTWPIAEA